MDNSLTIAFTCFMNKSILQVKKKKYEIRGGGKGLFILSKCPPTRKYLSEVELESLKV